MRRSEREFENHTFECVLLLHIGQRIHPQTALTADDPTVCNVATKQMCIIGKSHAFARAKSVVQEVPELSDIVIMTLFDLQPVDALLDFKHVQHKNI